MVWIRSTSSTSSNPPGASWVAQAARAAAGSGRWLSRNLPYTSPAGPARDGPPVTSWTAKETPGGAPAAARATNASDWSSPRVRRAPVTDATSRVVCPGPHPSRPPGRAAPRRTVPGARGWAARTRRRATRDVARPARSRRRRSRPRRRWPPWWLVEGLAAGAGAGGVGVVDGEARLLEGVEVVDGGAAEVGGAHLVGHHGHAVDLAADVAVQGAVVEEQRVAEPGAAARLDGDTQREVVATLAGQQVADLGRGRFAERDNRCRLGHLGHPCSFRVSMPAHDSGPYPAGGPSSTSVTSATSPPVARSRSPGAIGKTWRGVPAAAQTSSNPVRCRSISTGRSRAWPNGGGPPMAEPGGAPTSPASALRAAA